MLILQKDAGVLRTGGRGCQLRRPTVSCKLPLEDELGELTPPAKRLVATLEMIPLARFVPSSRGWIGRPSKDRLAIASAFVAKAVYGFALTRQLLDALASDTQLRRICGWNEPWQVP